MRKWVCETHGTIKEVSSCEVVFQQPRNCPRCGKKFGAGDTVMLKENVQCCNLCVPPQPLKLLPHIVPQALPLICWHPNFVNRRLIPAPREYSELFPTIKDLRPEDLLFTREINPGYVRWLWGSIEFFSRKRLIYVDPKSGGDTP